MPPSPPNCDPTPPPICYMQLLEWIEPSSTTDNLHLHLKEKNKYSLRINRTCQILALQVCSQLTKALAEPSTCHHTTCHVAGYDKYPRAATTFEAHRHQNLNIASRNLQQQTSVRIHLWGYFFPILRDLWS